MICAFCGKEFKDGAKFCVWCGKSQEVVKNEEPAPLPETVACECCGKEIKRNAKFCMWCGATRAVAETIAAVEEVAEPIPEQIPEVVEEPTPEPEPEPEVVIETAPVQEAEPEPEPEPEPEVVPEPTPKPEVKPEIKPEIKPEVQPEAKPKKKKVSKEKKEKSQGVGYVTAIISGLLIAFVTAMPFLPAFATGITEIGSGSKSLHYLTETIISLIGGWNNDIESGKNVTMVLAWTLRGLWGICAVLGLIAIIRLIISAGKPGKFSAIYLVCFAFNILFQALAQAFVFLCKATYSSNVFGKALPIKEIQFNVICIAAWTALFVLCVVILPILKKKKFK